MPPDTKKPSEKLANTSDEKLADKSPEELATFLTAFNERVYREIPLSRQMGAEVRHIDSHSVIVAAPLAPNINHQCTAFGGSIHSIAVLSCWSLVTATLFDELDDLDENPSVDYVVIQDSRIEYLSPIDQDFEAHAKWASERERGRFLETLKKRGLARVSLQSIVKARGVDCARLEARFVAATRPKR